MLKLNHKKLEVWKQSLLLVKEVYRLTKTFPKEELFGITNQLRRASVSVVSNIAEGASRSSEAERRRFYEIARSSISEIDTQMEVSLQLNYVDLDSLKDFDSLLNQVFAMLSGMIK